MFSNPMISVSALSSILLMLSSVQVQSCTTFVVGKKASVDGSVMATHTNDGGGTTDPRFVRVPARDFAEGSMRPVYASPENYPRYVGTERQVPQYYPDNCEEGKSRCQAFEPIGYIPQVSHTFAYWEATYGTMNERQVGIAESTCSGVFVANAIGAGGKALFSIDQLSQIAMERAKTSREAVTIIGELAEKYGFYGESDSFEGGSESLIITDPNEAWVFHVLADPTATSAIWVAERVPDDSVAVVANMFAVREVNLTDTANFLGRADMWEIAESKGLWSKGQPTDFTATFSDGEYAHKYYSGRRMWGAFRLLAPSANLPAEYGNLKTDKPYPFSVPVDKKVGPQDMMSVLRDWYSGTDYSTDVGLAGGPFGTPDRYSGGSGEASVSGNWERTIALFRTSDSYVVQSRSWLPDSIGGVVWFGPHAAHGTVYVPLMAGMLSSPDCLAYGWQGVYNLTTSYWAHRLVENLAQLKFSYMIEDVRELQKNLEFSSQQLVDSLTEKYSKVDPTSDTSYLRSITLALKQNAEKAATSSVELFHKMMFKYADGNINAWKKVDKEADSVFTSYSTGYPSWWLQSVGYTEGPPPVEGQKAIAQKA